MFGPRTRAPALTFTVRDWLLKPPSCRTPRPSLLIVPPARIEELIARPTCSLDCPAVPWTAVSPPATCATVTVATEGRLRRPARCEITRTSSRFDALIVLAVSVSVRIPVPVVIAAPPVIPPWELKATRATVSLKPLSSQAAPPRTVTAAVSAIWLETRLRSAALVRTPVSAPPALPPVMVRSPVMALPAPVWLSSRRLTPFEKADPT